MAWQDATTEVQSLIASGWDIADLNVELAKRTGAWEKATLIQEDGRGGWDVSGRRLVDALRGIPGKTATQAIVAEQAETSEPKATARQVDYATSLLIAKARSGEGDGFVTTSDLIVGGRVDTRALRAMTRKQISALIGSLQGGY